MDLLKANFYFKFNIAITIEFAIVVQQFSTRFSFERKMSEELHKILNRITEDCGLVKYKYRCEKSKNRNEGMFSVMSFVVLEGQTKDGQLKKLDLLVKYNPKDLRGDIPLRDMFLKEIFIYEDVVPTFEENQIKINNITKCYATSKENEHEMLVFDNLREAGYSLWPLNVPMDHNHLALVIKNYARLHGCSFILKQKNMPKYQHIVQEITKPIDDKKLDFFLDLVYKHSEKTAQALKPETDGNAIKKYKAFLKDFKTLTHNYIYMKDSEYDDYYVLLHGDCWSNNILFKYEVNIFLFFFQLIFN